MLVDSSHNKKERSFLMFKLESRYKPSGDQPQAIEKLKELVPILLKRYNNIEN